MAVVAVVAVVSVVSSGSTMVIPYMAFCSKLWNCGAHMLLSTNRVPPCKKLR